MWSLRVQYAIRTLIALAAQANARTSAREIAERYGVPRKYLETILADLRQNGFVLSTKGKAGGYELAREPTTIRFSEVIAAFEPEWVPVSDARVPGETRPEEPSLRMLQESLFGKLSEITVSDALLRWQNRSGAPMYSI